MKKTVIFLILVMVCLVGYGQNQIINGNVQVNGTWNSNYEAGIIIGRSGWQEGNTLGNRYVPVGARSGTLYLDFSGFRDRVQYQVGARIAGERYNIYEGENAMGALVQKTHLVFYTNHLGGWTTETIGLEERMRITHDGKIGINTSKPLHELDVNGTIRAKEVKIEATGWADFVFKPNYDLKTLSEVETHISKYGHLPNIPSEAEVGETGIDVGNMQIKLLQKIEELTLYVIEMDKENKSLRKEISEIKDQLKDK
ncbi:hypothetical protein [Dysgonomonas sp. ZJ279]|uniref:hypothetical protein n=1 Tax=Dysgonomonas sp. ZJ279 TaxID=2709796 RepID=UPI002107A273|nr:hypothetical protein [Dysgonomonas sp. ZJ279]